MQASQKQNRGPIFFTAEMTLIRKTSKFKFNSEVEMENQRREMQRASLGDADRRW